MSVFLGIADAHGLESLIEERKVSLVILQLRAEANRHRHAVVYRVVLPEEEAEIIRQELGKDPVSALMRLKEALGIEVEKKFVRSWKMIPNHSLDPYWGENE